MDQSKLKRWVSQLFSLWRRFDSYFERLSLAQLWGLWLFAAALLLWIILR